MSTRLPAWPWACGVVEGERYGNRAWSVSGKAFAWERPFSKADIRRFGDASPPDGRPNLANEYLRKQ